MSSVKVSKAHKECNGVVKLSGSKSISNRVLIIQALMDQEVKIENLSDSDDTHTLKALLSSDQYELDTHHAGTTFRFLTAYLAFQPGENILTGSERMKNRPIAPLVEALKALGAQIEYMEKEGYPPLKIGDPKKASVQEIDISSGISSQYISALLMMAPTLEKGLRINLTGEMVSRPYLEMTLSVMKYFGIDHTWDNQSIYVGPQKYKARDIFVEADWSAASYYYAIAALSDEAKITLKGLLKESLQGDAAIADISTRFGVETSYGFREITLSKKAGAEYKPFFEYDFINQPDIAQTVAVICAGKGINGLFTGLQTLRIKETDRIAALQQELAKVGVYLIKAPDKFSKKTGIEYYMIEGKAVFSDPPSFATYEDHRMAMAFAPLALISDVIIENASVVSKSYPDFWNDLQSLGFEIEKES